jgi:hypothetical protein
MNRIQKNAGTDKKGFILYKDFNSTLDKLSDTQAGKVFKAIYKWQLSGELPEMDFALELVITPIIEQFNRDASKWESTRASRSDAGRKGGLAKQANARSAKQNKQDLANLAVSDSVNEKVSVIKRFKAPSVEDVKKYILGRGIINQSEAERFVDFYASKGWLVGKNSMKDWKAAVRNWERGNSNVTPNGGKSEAEMKKERAEYGL